MRRLGSILSALLKKEGYESILIMAEAHRLWREFAGPSIRDLASVDSYHDGVLTLRLKSPTVEIYINQHSQQLLRALRSAGLPVKRLERVVG